MHRTANVLSHNNILVPEEEIIKETTVNEEQELLRKENSDLKVEIALRGQKEGGEGKVSW